MALQSARWYPSSGLHALPQRSLGCLFSRERLAVASPCDPSDTRCHARNNRSGGFHGDSNVNERMRLVPLPGPRLRGECCPPFWSAHDPIPERKSLAAFGSSARWCSSHGKPSSPVLAAAASANFEPADSGYGASGYYDDSPAQPPPVFVSYTFYKGRAALDVKPIKPTFRRLQSGAFALAREGTVLLTFAPAVATKQYDWARKHVFAISVAEMGKLTTLAAGERAEFYHDPNMNTPRQGQLVKVLTVEPFSDNKGFFLNLSVRESGMETQGKQSIPLTMPEFAILRTTMNYIMPYCLGWHVWVDPSLVSESMVQDRAR